MEADIFCQPSLLEDLDLLGRDYCIDGEIDPDAPLLAGNLFDLHEVQPGLILQRAQVRDLLDLKTRVVLLPSLKLTLLVSGSTEMRFGDRHYHLGPESPDPGNHAALVSLCEPEVFERRWRCDRSERKVSITIRPEWLEQAGLGPSGRHRGLAAFASRHLAEHVWQPSSQALHAARQILDPPPLDAALGRMFIEARCLDIVLEALSVAACAAPAAPVASPHDRQRLRRLHALLDSGDADDWSIQRIAHQVGSNPTTLQRLFHGDTGMTIFGYLRHRRLQQAFRALGRNGVSVERAAEIAGYANATNFATAFKRQFGLTPRQARRASRPA